MVSVSRASPVSTIAPLAVYLIHYHNWAPGLSSTLDLLQTFKTLSSLLPLLTSLYYFLFAVHFFPAARRDSSFAALRPFSLVRRPLLCFASSWLWSRRHGKKKRSKHAIYWWRPSTSSLPHHAFKTAAHISPRSPFTQSPIYAQAQNPCFFFLHCAFLQRKFNFPPGENQLEPGLFVAAHIPRPRPRVWFPPISYSLTRRESFVPPEPETLTGPPPDKHHAGRPVSPPSSSTLIGITLRAASYKPLGFLQLRLQTVREPVV